LEGQDMTELVNIRAQQLVQSELASITQQMGNLEKQVMMYREQNDPFVNNSGWIKNGCHFLG